MNRIVLLLLGTFALLAMSPIATASDDPAVNITSAEETRSNLGVDEPAPVAEIYGSPYGSTTIRTMIVDNSSERDVRAPVLDALSYWENNSFEYAGYPVNYTLVDDDPELKITLVDDVSRCGYTVGFFYGCADVIEDRPRDTVDARVEATLSNPMVNLTTIHEIGHTLGLEHDDDPQYLMSSPLPSSAEQKPTHVYLGDDVPSEEVLAGLRYVRENVDNVTGGFNVVTEPADAGIIIKVDDDECGEAFVACTRPEETFSDQQRIFVDDDVEDNAVAWYASFYASSAGERPDILTSDTDYDKRESEWWN